MRLLTVAGLLAAITVPLSAQSPPPAGADTAAQLAVIPAASSQPRAGWFSDRFPLRAGALLTIVVDEATAASERVSTRATADRGQRAQIGVGLDPANRLGPAKDFRTGLESSSSDVGESGRRGQLTAVLTVRVLEIDANGVATIEGTKNVVVDGRTQQVKLRGLVRAEDVSSRNLVSSSRIADAVITYDGKKIGPRSGILGKILSILWP